MTTTQGMHAAGMTSKHHWLPSLNDQVMGPTSEGGRDTPLTAKLILICLPRPPRLLFVPPIFGSIWEAALGGLK